MNTTELQFDEVKSAVRERYGQIAEDGGSCCAPTCCGGTDRTSTATDTLGYSTDDLAAAPDGSNLGLGCGNPLAIASLRAGQSVLDLGSGAGFDAFLAARVVGATGRAIGVDMTAAMISKARRNAVKGGFANVEFRLGEIEHLPVGDATIDVILSNCVINLSPDKPQVFREAFRVLKPGGRLAISDIVALRPLPEALRKNWELYTGCASGAAQVEDLRAMLAAAGFERIRIEPKGCSSEVLQTCFPGQRLENCVASATIEALKAAR